MVSLSRIFSLQIPLFQDIVEVQKDAVSPGQRFLIIDDLLATGGTLRAATEVIKLAGGIPAEAFLLIELTSLKGRAVNQDIKITSLLAYDEE